MSEFICVKCGRKANSFFLDNCRHCGGKLIRRRIDLDQIYYPETFATTRDVEVAPILQKPRKPLENVGNCFAELVKKFSIKENDVGILDNKIENACRKILMMCKGGEKAINFGEEIMIGQDGQYVVLTWDDEIELLYHLEAMILFGKSALDIFAYIFSNFLFGKRIDSFNKFCKILLQESDSKLLKLKETIQSLELVQTSWLNILRGSEKGRSLRDKIAHQTIAKIDFSRDPSDRFFHFCVVVGEKEIPLKEFVKDVTEGLIEFCLLAEDTILHF